MTTPYEAAFERETKGIKHLSPGHCEGCGECPEEQGESIGDEGSFSHSSCDTCGSTLGGMRYAAHGMIDLDGVSILCHFDICTDCMLFMANGDTPDAWRASAGA